MNIAIAKRENNSKREYLLVNTELSRHTPSDPRRTIRDCKELGEKLKKYVEEKKKEEVLVISFAEAATAIGAEISNILGDNYFVTTTREEYGEVGYTVLRFEEEHSHATSHRLYIKDDFNFNAVKVVILIDDEFTTGNTVLNLVKELRTKVNSECTFVAGSFLSIEESRVLFKANEIEAEWLSSVEDSQTILSAIKGEYKYPKEYKMDAEPNYNPNIFLSAIHEMPNSRVCIGSEEYSRKVQLVVKEIADMFMEVGSKGKNKKTIRIVGVEEFTHIALEVGLLLQEQGLDVVVQSITRSPMLVSKEEGYVLKSRVQIPSVYDVDRKVYLYNNEDKTDAVIVISDVEITNEIAMSAMRKIVKVFNTDEVYWVFG